MGTNLWTIHPMSILNCLCKNIELFSYARKSISSYLYRAGAKDPTLLLESGN